MARVSYCFNHSGIDLNSCPVCRIHRLQADLEATEARAEEAKMAYEGLRRDAALLADSADAAEARAEELTERVRELESLPKERTCECGRVFPVDVDHPRRLVCDVCVVKNIEKICEDCGGDVDSHNDTCPRSPTLQQRDRLAKVLQETCDALNAGHFNAALRIVAIALKPSTDTPAPKGDNEATT